MAHIRIDEDAFSELFERRDFHRQTDPAVSEASGRGVVHTHRGAGALQHILFGGAIIASMLVLPGGLWGGAERLVRWARGRAA